MRRWLAIFALLLAQAFPAGLVCASVCDGCPSAGVAGGVCCASPCDDASENSCCSACDEEPAPVRCQPLGDDQCGCVLCPKGGPQDRTQDPTSREAKSAVELALIRAGLPGWYPAVEPGDSTCIAFSGCSALAPDADAGVTRARLCSWTI
ncbi:MAG: hypothetical protein ACKVZJ_02590 [Phycisphaerales bacterium]